VTADPTAEGDKGVVLLDFDRRLMLQFCGSAITPDAGLLPYRELDDALGLTETGADPIADARTGKYGRHRLTGLLRHGVRATGRRRGRERRREAVSRSAIAVVQDAKKGDPSLATTRNLGNVGLDPAWRPTAREEGVRCPTISSASAAARLSWR
jgi:hypothetical protein